MAPKKAADDYDSEDFELNEDIPEDEDLPDEEAVEEDTADDDLVCFCGSKEGGQSNSQNGKEGLIKLQCVVAAPSSRLPVACAAVAATQRCITYAGEGATQETGGGQEGDAGQDEAGAGCGRGRGSGCECGILNWSCVFWATWPPVPRTANTQHAHPAPTHSHLLRAGRPWPAPSQLLAAPGRDFPALCARECQDRVQKVGASPSKEGTGAWM
eukprot:1159189-Pelagomonas_calceolata.AAC.11